VILLFLTIDGFSSVSPIISSNCVTCKIKLKFFSVNGCICCVHAPLHILFEKSPPIS
jgi:hypothetical protein